MDRRLVKYEVPASGDYEDWTDGITDYTLSCETGEIIAVIEAKRQSRSPQPPASKRICTRLASSKTKVFVRSFFLANGLEIWFWDTTDAPREVRGFFTLEDLETFLKQHKTQLANALINPNLAAEMRNRREQENIFVSLDLPDFIAAREYIKLSESGERIFVEEYRQRVE